MRIGPYELPSNAGCGWELIAAMRAEDPNLEIAQAVTNPGEVGERRPRKLSPLLIRVGRPLLRFSPMWEGYVLRFGGERIGPVFEPKPGRYRKPGAPGSRPEIESGRLPMDQICTHQLPLPNFQEGLDLVAEGSKSIKVSLIP